MRDIGRLLKEEEKHFIGYSEIESLTTEMGFPISVRTLRFYVDEGILPAPNKIGKKPVYDKEWILNVLLSLHIMKTRMNRSLKDIKAILDLLTEDPKHLADSLSVLYEDWVRSDALKPVQRDALIEGVFGLLTGLYLVQSADQSAEQSGQAFQASDLDLSALVEVIEEEGQWIHEDSGIVFKAPSLERMGDVVIAKNEEKKSGPKAIQLKIKEKSVNEPIQVKVKTSPKSHELRPTPGETVAIQPEAVQPEATQPRAQKAKLLVPLKEPKPKKGRSGDSRGKSVPKARRVEGDFEVVDERSVTEPVGPIPDGAVSLIEARAREEFYLSRFEMEFESQRDVLNPLTGKSLKISSKNCSPLRRDHSANIIQKMKGRQIYDRELLDAIPLERASEFHIYRRGFFGRGELQVVVTGLALSPIDQFLEHRYGTKPLGSVDVQRAISELVIQEGIFYYIGIFSTTGWTPEALRSIPQDKNLLCSLIEKHPERGWRVHGKGDDRWGRWVSVFDPESESEKVERVRSFLKSTPKLKLKGGHVVLRNVVEDMDLPRTLIDQAVEDVMVNDKELSLETVEKYEILKRRRF